jgi:hypothetical protein
MVSYTGCTRQPYLKAPHHSCLKSCLMGTILSAGPLPSPFPCLCYSNPLGIPNTASWVGSD